jgi:hypothetical protein
VAVGAWFLVLVELVVTGLVLLVKIVVVGILLKHDFLVTIQLITQ